MVKFGEYLDAHARDIWRSQYIKCVWRRAGHRGAFC